MELNQEWLAKARSRQMDFLDAGSQYALTAAIETYLAEMFKPSQVMTVGSLEAIPQRDYRKELWIDVATATAAHATQGFQPASWADETLKAFDTAFPQEPTNG